jgi:cell division protein FtsB
MNVDLGIWGKLTRLVIFLLLLAGVLGVAVWYLPVIKQNERMRKEILRLDTKHDKEKADNRELKTATETLQKDPKAVERLTRERLGYARTDEIVVRFEKPATNQVSPR